DIPPSGDTGSTGWCTLLFQGRADEVNSREQVTAFLAQIKERGVLTADEFTILQGVLVVADTQVHDNMITLRHMVVLEQDRSPEELLKTVIESNHSRFPVIGEDRDEVVGIVLAKDFLRQFVANREAFNLESLIRPAVFIPESKRLNTLLTDFRESRNHMAIVVDEYGGVAG